MTATLTPKETVTLQVIREMVDEFMAGLGSRHNVEMIDVMNFCLDIRKLTVDDEDYTPSHGVDPASERVGEVGLRVGAITD